MAAYSEPLAIPIPLAKGEPGEGYPWDWSIYRWLPGRIALVSGTKTVSFRLPVKAHNGPIQLSASAIGETGSLSLAAPVRRTASAR